MLSFSIRKQTSTASVPLFQISLKNSELKPPTKYLSGLSRVLYNLSRNSCICEIALSTYIYNIHFDEEIAIVNADNISCTVKAQVVATSLERGAFRSRSSRLKFFWPVASACHLKRTVFQKINPSLLPLK